MPLPTSSESRPERARRSDRRSELVPSKDSGVSRAGSSGLLSLRNVAVGLLVVLGICGWQVVLLSSHVDPVHDTQRGSEVLWHHLSVAEANLTALASQQRELQRLLSLQQSNAPFTGQQLPPGSALANSMARAADAQKRADSQERDLKQHEGLILELQAELARMKQRFPEDADKLAPGRPAPVPGSPPGSHQGGGGASSGARGSKDKEAKGGSDGRLKPPESVIPTDGKWPAEWLKSFSVEELEASAREAEKWRIMAKGAAVHAWKGYRERAWGQDEMKPVSGQVGRHWANCGLQILDALGTLWVMGLTAQFDEATEWVEHSLNWNYEGKASFFEITIRALGGLASAHSLSGREVFLRKAKELADRMLPAFSANPGFPKTEFNMKTGQGMNGWYQGTVLSEAGTVQLEFRYISQQTGNPVYGEKADRSMRAIIEAEKGRGLVPWGLNRDGPPHFTNSHITFGAMGDSYYEYLLKMYLQTGGTEPEWLEAWRRAMDKMEERLILKTAGGLTYIAEEKDGRIDHKMDHLACFVGGMLIYGARQLPKEKVDPRWEETATGITETCYQMYHRQPSHLAPEAAALRPQGRAGDDLAVWNNAAHYLLRPETAEAIYYMFYYTGDPKYRRMAGEIMEAIETHCRTKYGYSAVRDVRSTNPQMRDEMETFFMAETLKYLYLTFVPIPRDIVDLNEFVFTTEAHPLRVFRAGSAGKRQKQFLGN